MIGEQEEVAATSPAGEFDHGVVIVHHGTSFSVTK
jgi:hypothetical protein